MPKAPAKKPSAKKTTVPPVEAPAAIPVELVYPELDVLVCKGEHPLTVEKAKKLLGWEEETETNKFKDDYLLRDEYGKKIRCHRNKGNRPFYAGNMEKIKQEILNRNFQLNGETIIIGCNGTCLSAQHRLIALILAAQEVERHPEKWEHRWKEEPFIETLIAVGVSEEDKVVNTIETGKTRSLSDVIFRCEYFANHSPKDKKALASICENAIMFLWARTGVGENAFEPLKTHAKAIDFFNRHPKLRECVKHIWEENGSGEEGGKIKKFIGCGWAAGMLYLMGSSKSNPKQYIQADEPCEADLNWDNWDLACEFFVKLADGSKDYLPIRTALARLHSDDNEVEYTVSMTERCALLTKAWHCIVSGTRLTPAAIQLKYAKDEDGGRTLTECPVLGGIDKGVPKDEEPEVHADPTQEEIEERKAAIRKEREDKEAAEAKKPNKRNTQLSPKAKPFKAGQQVWVKDEDGDIWQGKLLQLDGQAAKVKFGDQSVDVTIANLSHDEPE